MLKLLIVDDSPTMRALVRCSVQASGDIQVVGEVSNPYEAREAIKALSPDVMTLDIHMPHMSGLDFLEKLMRLHPMPVVILSSVASSLDPSIRAIPGVTVMDKADFSSEGADVLAHLLRRVVRSFDGHFAVNDRKSVALSQAVDSNMSFTPNDKFVVVGSSTGGVDALLELFSKYPRNCPPTVVTQHMPAGFTTSFSSRLNRCCLPDVVEARSGLPLVPGKIYIAPGSKTHLRIVGHDKPMCRVSEGELISGHRPSVDALFKSAARFGERGVGVILTGMGRDGADGMLEMRRAGASTFGQNAKTSLVYGMPKAAAECGAVETVLPLSRIAPAVLSVCNK